jgi:hypothetical protein
VIDRIEAGIGAIDGMEEGQQVNAAECAFERAVEQRRQVAERATP